MATPAFAALWFLPFVTPIAVWVAWSDMKSMKIPNKAVLALLGVFLIIGPFVLPLAEWGVRWLHFAVVLVVGFVMNALKMIGAGDAKFAAAMAPFVALGDFRVLVFLLAACAAAALVTHRGFKRFAPIRRLTPDWESWTREKEFPFGLPLAGTLIIYLVLAALG